MGGEGGTGGPPLACTEAADCNDDNVCTIDFCDPETDLCSNAPVTEETVCDDNGGPGLCSEGMCAPVCDVKDCSDGNDCTQDNCNPADGVCSNPNEADDTACSDNSGTCQSGACVLRCADAATRCDDSNDCTDNDCDPADGTCINTALTGSACDLDGVGGVCNAGVCEASALCSDQATRCDDGNECTDNLCDPADGVCSNPNVADNTSCADDAGKCQNGTCVIAADEFLAMDCELLSNSAALPVDAKVTPSGVAFAGQPVDVLIEDSIILPAVLVCNFIGAGFVSSEVDNSLVGNAISNADITSVTLDSFIDDSCGGNACTVATQLVDCFSGVCNDQGTVPEVDDRCDPDPTCPAGVLNSPHFSSLFDFGTACGDSCVGGFCTSDGTTACTLATFTEDCSVANGGGVGTGPGIVAQTFRRNGASETIPPGPTPFPITPTAAGTVDFVIEYSGTALDLKNLSTDVGVLAPVACLGGACAFDLCADQPRGSIDSPRIMYDATCNKTQAAEPGGCTPFLDFSTVADVCKGAGLEPADLSAGNIPACCDNQLPCVAPCAVLPSDLFCVTDPNVTSCCNAISTDYPSPTPAQQPQLPVNPAP